MPLHSSQKNAKNIPITIIVMWKIEKARMVIEYFGVVMKKIADVKAGSVQHHARIGNSFVW